MLTRSVATLTILVAFTLNAFGHGSSDMTIRPTDGAIFEVHSGDDGTYPVSASSFCQAALYWSTGVTQMIWLRIMGNPSGTGYGNMTADCEGSSMNGSEEIDLPRSRKRVCQISGSTKARIGVDPEGTSGSQLTRRTSKGKASFYINYPYAESLIPPVVVYKRKDAKEIPEHSHIFYVMEK